MILKYPIHHYYHEAAHLVIAKLLPDVEILKIKPYCSFYSPNNSTNQLVMAYLAGVVIEQILFDKVYDKNDLEVVKTIKQDYFLEQGKVQLLLLMNMTKVLRLGRILMNQSDPQLMEKLINNI